MNEDHEVREAEAAPADAPRQSGAIGDRDELGRFAKGNRYSVGKGRPPGSYDLVSIARKRARKAGIDLKGELWSALLAMLEAAKLGDTNAARIVFERLAKPLDKGATVELHLEQNLAVGPPVPSGGDLAQYVLALQRVAQSIGLVPGEAPAAALPSPRLK